MKRKIDLVEEEEHESEHEESESSGDESVDEEPRIKDVLSHLSRAVPESVLLICCIVWPRTKILERLRFTFTAHGKRQTSVENFSK